jgi:hypothetical protein
MRAAGGAPESQSQDGPSVRSVLVVGCAGGAPESGSMRRWVGVRGDGVSEMGWG